MSLRKFLKTTRLLLAQGLYESRRAIASESGTDIRTLQLHQLEERILMSASPLAAAASAPDAAAATDAAALTDGQLLDVVANSLLPQQDAAEPDAAPQTASTVDSGSFEQTAAAHTLELVFLDSAVSDLEQMLADLQAANAQDDNRTLEVVVLDADRNGIAQMTSTLMQFRDVDAIHIVSHGRDGQLQLGSTLLSQENLEAYRSAITAWQYSLSDDADLLFYGCDLAATAEGQELMNLFAAACGCDVAASEDLTGHADLGGDWDLEYVTGQIETQVALSAELQASWQHVLAATVDAASSGATADQASVTVSHTTSGTNRLMLVAVSMQPEGESVTSVTSNGSNLSLVGVEENPAGKARVEVWQLLAPSTGTHDVVVNLSGNSHKGVVVGVQTFNNVNQTTPTYGFSSSSGNSSTASATVLASAADDLVFGAVQVHKGSSVSPGTGQTENWDLAISNANGGGTVQSGGGTVSPDWTVNNEKWSAAAITVQADTNSVQSVTLTAVKDAYIQDKNPNVSDGTSGTMIIDREDADLQRALVQFDLSGLPAGITISDAQLNLNATSVDGLLTVEAYQLQQSWTEASVTWNQRSSGTNWSTTGGTFNSTALDSIFTDATGTHTFSITSLVQDWVDGVSQNYGVLIGSPDGGGNRTVNYTTRESATAPELVIYYEVTNNPPTDITPNSTNVNEHTDTSGGYSVATLNTADPDAGDTFTYSIVGGADAAKFSIGGAGLNQLLLTDGILNFEVKPSYSVTLRTTDSKGATYDETLTVNVNNLNDAPAGIPAIIGSFVENQLLTADTSGISDPDGLGAFTYQWLRNGSAVGGATSATYLLDDPDVGAQMSVEVRYVDGLGTSEGPLTSLPSTAVVNVNDAPVNTVPGTQTILEETTTGIPGISILDIDAAGSSVTTELQVSAGTLNVVLSGSTAISAGSNGTASFLLKGSVSDINATLASLTYTGNTDVVGTAADFLIVTTNDGGNSGSGGALEDIDSIQIDIVNVNDTPVGLPAIVGTASEDQVLTGDNSGISDGDGLGVFTYQWLRDGAAITGANGSTYLLGDADVDTRISLEVSYTDGNGTAEGPLTSAQTGPIVNVNDIPVGLPAISGTTTEDQVLTADTSGISDADGLGAFNYQWLRNGTAVGGATGSTYLLGDADVGTRISLQVSYIDGYGTAEGPLTSVQTNPIVNVNDAPVGLPVIVGTTTEDQVLTADTSGISDADGLGAFTYQWLRDGAAIVGATGNTYLLGDADVGTRISLQVSYTDGYGTAEGPLTSVQTGPIVNVNDAPVGLPVIVGTTTEDQVLSADTSGISDADGLGAFTYQWLRDGAAIAGATGSTYLPGDADVGTRIGVQVSYTDGNGTAEGPLTSAQTSPIVNVNDEEVLVTNTGLTVHEGDIGTTVTTSMLSTFDIDNTSVELVYTLTASPVTGTLRLAGTALSSGGTFTQADINASLLAYDHSGSETFLDSFAFRVNDGSGTSTSGTFSITILPVNDNLPVISPGQIFSVSEHVPVGTLIGTVSAGDADTGTILQTWTISAGNDSGIFSIDAATGALSLADITSLDFELADVHTLILTVSDGTFTSAAQVVSVTVIDENDRPVLVSPTTINLDENTPNGTLVGTVAASDQDTPEVLTYSIVSGPSTTPFVLDSLTGQIRVADAGQLDFEVSTSFTLGIQVTDSGALTDAQLITINLSDVNEAPVAVALNGSSVAENSDPGTMIGSVTGFDADAGDVLTWSLIDSAGGRFALDSATGRLTVADGTLLNFEADTDHAITVRGTDADGLTRDESFLITVTDINDAPVAANDSYSGKQLQTLVVSSDSVMANDVDEDADSLTAVLISGPTSGTLTLNGDGTFSYTPDGSFSGLDSFTYYVTDGSLHSSPATVEIEIITTLSGLVPTSGASDSGGDSSTNDTNPETESTDDEKTTALAAARNSAAGPSGTSSRSRHGSGTETVTEQGAQDSVSDILSSTASEQFITVFLDVVPDGQSLRAEASGAGRGHDSDEQVADRQSDRFLFAPITTINPFVDDGSFGLTPVDYIQQQQEQRQQEQLIETVVIGSTAALSTSFSVGYVIWLLRGGSLMATILSSLPVWQAFDPLPVLDSFDQDKDGHDDQESLASLVSGA